MLGDPRERRRVVRQRQQIVEIDAVMRRPREMLRKAFRPVAVAQGLESREMVAIERFIAPIESPTP